MLGNKSPAILAVVSLLFSICLAVIVLFVQRKTITKTSPASNQARAVWQHYVASRQVAAQAREQIKQQQAEYLAAYNARYRSTQPFIEEVP